ncbi:MAG: hypothetical protein ACXAB7_13590 [Candidatus Kariarchaeaceae archaeon]|jgi:hypothetical protein
MSKEQLNEASHLFTLIGGSLMLLTGFLGIFGESLPMMSSSGNFLLSIITMVFGGVALSIQLEKAPFAVRLPMKIKFNRGMTYIIMGIITIRSGLGPIFLFLAGLLYIWDKLEKLLKEI